MQYAPEALNTYGFGWHNQIGIRYANIHVFKILSSFLSLSVFMSFIPIKGCFFFFVITYPVNICTTSFIRSNLFYSSFQKHLPVSVSESFQRISLTISHQFRFLLLSLKKPLQYCLLKNNATFKAFAFRCGSCSLIYVYFFEKKQWPSFV